MKIAIPVVTYSKTIGVGRGVVELSEQFARLGHTVHIFTNFLDKKSISPQKNITFHKISLFWGPKFLRKFSRWWRVISFPIKTTSLLKKEKKYDIVYARGVTSFIFDIISAHSCHLAGSLQEIRIEKDVKTTLIKLLNPANYLICLTEWYNYRRATRVITVSNRLKEELRRYYGVTAEKIVVIPNGINLNEFNLAIKEKFREEMRAKYNLLRTDIILLTVANEFRRKGIKYLLQALFLIPQEDIKLMVIGKKESSLTTMENYIKRFNLQHRLLIIDHTDEIEKYYAAGDIFVFPTLYEAFGLVTLETMAMGLPLIVSKNAGVTEFLTDGVNALLLNDPTDPSEIKEKITQLLTNRKLRETIVENAFQLVAQFTWEKIAAKIIQEFINLKNWVDKE